MPIKDNKRHHDFEWEFERGEGQMDASALMRLHITPEFGWTVSMLSDDYSVESSMPAQMFLDVAEEIRRVTNSSLPARSAPSVSQQASLTSVPRVKIGLPEINRNETASPPLRAVANQPDQGFESFTAPISQNQEPEPRVIPQPEVTPIDENDEEMRSIAAMRGGSKEERERMRQEKLQATKSKSIRRSNPSGDEE